MIENMFINEKSRLIYIDETGMDIYYAREHCYAQKGECIIGEVAGKKYSRVPIVAGKRNGEILASFTYKGTTTTAFFDEWLEFHLMQIAKEGDVIILDNA